MLDLQAHAEMAGRNAPLLEKLRELALVPLADVYDAILAVLPGQLLSSAGESGPHQLDLVDAVREVRRRREAMLARFRAHLANAWQMLEAGRPLSVEYKLADGRADELSLVSNQELEVRLAVRALADDLASRWKPELMRLTRYLGLAAGGLRLDEDTLPFGPHHIGVAVYESLSACTLTPSARRTVVQLCEAELQARTGALYTRIEQGLLALVQSSRQPRARNPTRRWIPRGVPAPGGGMDQAQDWIGRFFVQWDGGDPSGAVKRARDAFNEHLRSDTALLPPALHELLQRARNSDGPLPSSAGKRDLSQGELLSILSLMQGAHEPVAAQSPGLSRRLSQQVKWEILAGAGRLGIDPTRIRLAASDEDAIDLVCMLLDVMLKECNLQGRPRDLMLQLPAPYIKVAMLDRELFLNEQHPARRLLNLLADACERCIGDGEAERALLVEIERAVAAVLQDFSDNVATFAPIAGRFSDCYAQYLRRIQIAERRATEMHRAQERREEARGFAQDTLQARITGLAMPARCEDFLRQYWVPYVAGARLRGEAAQADIALANDCLNALVAAIRADELHGADTPWLKEWEPWLLGMLAQQGLDGVATDAARRTLAHSLHAAPAAVAPAPPAPVAPADEVVAALLEGSQSAADVDPSTAEFFRDLPLGTWLDFVDRMGRVRVGKLNWISPISSRLMFVDKLGSRLCVVSPEELAAMAHLERLRLHRDEDAFYSAMQGAIEQLAP